MELSRDSLIFLSDDLTHDHFAVFVFLHKAIEYLRMNNIACLKIIRFSDGCAAQYKSKGPLVHMTMYGIEIELEWHYFGSEHGKVESDGEVGCVKTGLEKAVLGRKVILNNAEEVYVWSQIPLLHY